MIITGPAGVGKSFLASALGHQGCMYGFRVLYANSLKLFSHLKQSSADGSYVKKTKEIQKSDLFILDDFGLQALDSQNRLALFEIIEDRHGKRSTIIVSQLPVKNWHEIIGDATIADAICDRLVHSAHKIELKGDSVRKNQKQNKKD
jgi:DNA replication protein DnaC